MPAFSFCSSVLALVPLLTPDAAAVKTLEPSLVIRATTTVAAMPDRRFIFGRDGHRGLVWDALTGNLILSVPGYGGAFDPRSGNIIIGPELWNLPERTQLGALGVEDKAVIASGFSPDGSKAVVASRGGATVAVQVWDLTGKRSIGRVEMDIKELGFLALSSDAKFLAAGQGKIFSVVEVATGRVAKMGAIAAVWPFKGTPAKGFTEFVDDRARDFDLVYKRSWAPVSGSERPLWLIDWEAGRANIFAGYSGIPERRKSASASAAVLSAASPDRWTAASANAAGRVSIRDVQSGEVLYAIEGDGGQVISLAYSPDAQFLLVGTSSVLRVYAISP